MSSQDMEDNLHPPSQDSSQDPSKKERVWKLKDGKMEISSCGKKNERDPFMSIDMVFKFDDEPSSQVVGELHQSYY
jgi:hypothetical protein